MATLCKKWGIWLESQPDNKGEDGGAEDSIAVQHVVRLWLQGREVRGRFSSVDEAKAFQLGQLYAHFGWPRQPLTEKPFRDPVWDHPESLEEYKEYTFHEVASDTCSVLSEEQVLRFNEKGFLFGLPILCPEELEQVRRDFDELLSSRIDRAPNEEARFRAAHTLSRPLHEPLVVRLAKHERVLAIVENILGPRFVCWSAHLFCKLAGDPTEQPWHQDAGFWPLSQSRALTLWIAFDDVDASNASLTFIAGSHRIGPLPWHRTSTHHKLLTQEIPNVYALGPSCSVQMRAGEASVHCDLTIHGSPGNSSSKRRAGLALRYVQSDVDCLGPMINGYEMNKGCLLPKANKSDPRGHWKPLRRRPGGRRAPRFPVANTTS